jgi:hypothetical protein
MLLQNFSMRPGTDSSSPAAEPLHRSHRWSISEQNGVDILGALPCSVPTSSKYHIPLELLLRMRKIFVPSQRKYSFSSNIFALMCFVVSTLISKNPRKYLTNDRDK